MERAFGKGNEPPYRILSRGDCVNTTYMEDEKQKSYQGLWRGNYKKKLAGVVVDEAELSDTRARTIRTRFRLRKRIPSRGAKGILTERTISTGRQLRAFPFMDTCPFARNRQNGISTTIMRTSEPEIIEPVFSSSNDSSGNVFELKSTGARLKSSMWSFGKSPPGRQLKTQSDVSEVRNSRTQDAVIVV